MGHEWKIANTSGQRGDSLGIELTGTKAGQWHDRATGEGGTFPRLLMLNRGLSFPEACRLIGEILHIDLETGSLPVRRKADAAHVSLTPEQEISTMEAFDWRTAIKRFDREQQQQLVAERAFLIQTLAWLSERGEIGMLLVRGRPCVAFPVPGTNGEIIGAHYRWPEKNTDGKHDWFYVPKGIRVGPLVHGRLTTAKQVLLFESPWDGIALVDRLALRDLIDAGEIAVVCTRGAQFGDRLVNLPLPEQCVIYAFPQNDVARERCLDSIVAELAREVRVVRAPGSFKDINDWTRDGAQKADLMSAIQAAEIRKPETTRPDGFLRFKEPSKGRKTQTGARESVLGENVEFVENSPSIPIEWENSTNSTISTSTLSQKAVLPEDSILESFYALAVTVTEGADCYIIGAILPVVAASLGRNVWVQWMEKRLYPNLFTMLAGKPSDRKTSTLDLAELLARNSLPDEAFLSENFSPETLFDEYDPEAGGRPDKIFFIDDAKVLLADWQKSTIGQRNAARFLRLYDCKGMSENYRRNRSKGQSKEAQKRRIDETSTSVVLGATFNDCMFRDQTVRFGMQRRFLYYVAEKMARVIPYPPDCRAKLIELAHAFELLGKLAGPFTLSESAQALFEKYQYENRHQINDADPLEESLLSRLGTSPTHVLKVAQNFEACRSVYFLKENHEIQEKTLEYAIAHVAECERAIAALDSITKRIYIANDAEVLLAKIRYDFRALEKDGSIVLTKSQLTSKYAHHGSSRQGLDVQDLYLRQLPFLIGRGDAQALPKEGKLERWAFRTEN
jgi:hypothetical protein